MSRDLEIATIRRRFPALSRTQDGQSVAFFDGPAGSQVPAAVADAVRDYLLQTNANTHGAFSTSRATDKIVRDAAVAVADFIGASHEARAHELIVFGQNMTSLTFAFSRALAQTWKPGDEIIVSRLDHDANITPWVLAAKDRGVTVHRIDVRSEDCTLRLDQLSDRLCDRTRLLAVGAASNATGTINPIARIAKMVHGVGGQLFVDAVHYAPHRLIDVAAWGCDYLVCSAYKFFGPHVGMLWGRRPLMASLPAYQVRPAGDATPGRWTTGTQSFEAIAGTKAAIDYLAEIGGVNVSSHPQGRRSGLVHAYERIVDHETRLAERLLRGLRADPAITVYGISEPERRTERCPTVAFTHSRHTPRVVAEKLAAQGIYAWSGNLYAFELSEALGLEPEGMVRVGILHYNTASEVERLLDAVRAL